MRYVHKGLDWIRFDQNEKLWKKNSRLFIIFPDFVFIFQTFSRSGELPGNFKTFSRIQASVRTLIITKGHLIKKIIMIWLIKILYVISTIIWPKITLSYNSIYIIISPNFFYVN